MNFTYQSNADELYKWLRCGENAVQGNIILSYERTGFGSRYIMTTDKEMRYFDSAGDLYCAIIKLPNNKKGWSVNNKFWQIDNTDWIHGYALEYYSVYHMIGGMKAIRSHDSLKDIYILYEDKYDDGYVGRYAIRANWYNGTPVLSSSNKVRAYQFIEIKYNMQTKREMRQLVYEYVSYYYPRWSVGYGVKP